VIDRIQIATKAENGKLIRNRKLIEQAVKHFEGKEVLVTIERKKSKRSLDQNAYLWGVCYAILEQCFRDAGCPLSTQDVHIIMRLKVAEEDRALIFEDVVNRNTGEILTSRMRSTTEFTKSEFSDYIMYLQKTTAEMFGEVIPDPDEQLQIG